MWVALFPGQGSQKIGMGRFYYEHFKTARILFESASDELKIDFKKLCFEESEDLLTRTENAQPAIVLISSVAWICLAKEIDLNFIKYCAGHSVGEYSALVSAGVLPLNTALKCVRKRGVYMQESVPLGEGGMSALVGATSEEAQKFCQWVEQTSGLTPLEIANFNTTKQTVLSGSLKALTWAQKNLKQFNFTSPKIRIVPLKVSAPFHSSLMQPAVKKMERFLKTIPFKQPDKIVIQNRVAKGVRKPELLKKNLTQQVKAPVLWQQSMQYLFDQGRPRFLELGEGKILSGLVKKIDISKEVFHFHSLKDIYTLQATFKNEDT